MQGFGGGGGHFVAERFGIIHCGPEPGFCKALSLSPTAPIIFTHGLSSHFSLLARCVSLYSIPRRQPVTLVDNCDQEITAIILIGGQGI